MNRTLVTIAAILAAAGAAPADHNANHPTEFRVRIENIASAQGQTASNGIKWPFAISPGLWAVHREKGVLFTPGKADRGEGLEAQAEDGNPTMLERSVRPIKGVAATGIFNTPVGAKELGPGVPGAAFEFTISATPGMRLSFTTMFGQSNDLFYAPDRDGIALFDAKGMPARGDITKKVLLWDAGTEVNEEPGIGPDQAPRQKSPNTGMAEKAAVRRIGRVKDGFHYPKTADVLRITITPITSSASR